MGLQHSSGPIVTNGLLFNLDATNPRCYNGQENLLFYSEEFDNPLWGITLFGTLATAQSSGEIAPDGTATADLITFRPDTTGQCRRNQYYIGLPSGTYTASVYVKRGTLPYINWYLTASQVPYPYVGYNFDTDTVYGTGTFARTIVGNGWVRLTSTYTITTHDANVGFIAGNEGTVYAWGGQLELSGSVTNYSKTTSSRITRTWFDLTDNRYNAVLTNNPVFSNNTLQFRATGQNATNQYGTITIDEGILRPNNKTKSWSLEAFFKYISAPGNSEAGIIAREGCNSGIYVNTDGTLNQAIKTDQCWTGAPIVNLGTLTAGNYYHTIMVYNSGTVTSYLNGVQVGTATLDTSLYDTFPHNNSLYIGGIRTLYATNTDINIARGYNRALTATEVSQNYQSVRGRFGV